MEALFPVLAVLGAMVFGIIAMLVNEQVKASVPALAVWLVSLAVRRLPEVLRSRYREEWLAVVAEVPGPLYKLYTAFGFLVATRGLARERESKLAAERGGERLAKNKRVKKPTDNHRVFISYDYASQVRFMKAWLRHAKDPVVGSAFSVEFESERLRETSRACERLLNSLEQRRAARAERRAFGVASLVLTTAMAIAVAIWKLVLH